MRLIGTIVLILGLSLPYPAHADSRCLEFQVAAQMNETARVAKFLDAGVDINCRDPVDANQTALMKAATGGSVEAVRMLLERGAEVNARSDGGWTAMKYARAVHQGVSKAGPSFAKLTRRIEKVIRLLQQANGVE